MQKVKTSRNTYLYNEVAFFVETAKIVNKDNLIGIALSTNDLICDPPLPVEEVKKIVNAAWDKERNGLQR